MMKKASFSLFDLNTNSSAKYKFGEKDDYEELVKVDSTYYVLNSTGDIIEINLLPMSTGTRYKYPDNEMKIEFESMV